MTITHRYPFRWTVLSIVCIIVTMTVFPSCKKKLFERPDELPAITQEGKHTFGCLVNGELMIPWSGLLHESNKFSKSNDDYYISITDDKKFFNLKFTAKSTGATTFCLKYNDSNKSCEYELCEKAEGRLEITKLDLENRIISGTFGFTLIGTGECSNINITEGRFDYKF